jgi:hypothetical protein
MFELEMQQPKQEVNTSKIDPRNDIIKVEKEIEIPKKEMNEIKQDVLG